MYRKKLHKITWDKHAAKLDWVHHCVKKKYNNTKQTHMKRSWKEISPSDNKKWVYIFLSSVFLSPFSFLFSCLFSLPPPSSFSLFLPPFLSSLLQCGCVISGLKNAGFRGRVCKGRWAKNISERVTDTRECRVMARNRASLLCSPADLCGLREAIPGSRQC